MNECVFCKIVNNEIPSVKIYENDKVLAFLDIAPVNPGHTLVVSKEHYKNIYDVQEEILKEIILVVKKAALAIKNAVNADGINIIQSNEKAAGQVINHIHFHVIPRKADDGLKHWPQKKYENNEVMNKIAESIRNSFS